MNDRNSHRGNAAATTDDRGTSNEAMFNREATLKRLGGKEELLATIAGFFLADAPPLIQQIRDALNSRDADQLTRAAHSLRGLSANFDARAVSETAQQMENHGRRAEYARAAQLLPQLTEQVQQLQNELNRIVS